MIPIQDLLNKIKWDPREKPEEYTLFYYDRVEDKLKMINYTDIQRIEEGFLIIYVDGKETNIPLHRIRKVAKNEQVVWER